MGFGVSWSGVWGARCIEKCLVAGREAIFGMLTCADIQGYLVHKKQRLYRTLQ